VADLENGLSEDQRHAVELVTVCPGPFFLTGPGGAGKSFLIRYLRRRMEGVRVTALTGMAAQLIGGTTLHSFVGIHPFRGLLPLPTEQIRERFKGVQLLVIDEISMANAELIDMLQHRMRQAEYRGKLLMTGDFLQLPPVEGAPIFDTEWWDQEVTTLVLSTQHRQHDREFIEILNEIRMGELTPRVQAFLASRRVDRLPEDCVRLLARNADVEAENHRRLSYLGTKIETSYARLTYNYTFRKRAESREAFEERMAAKVDWKRVRMPRALHLAVGARVVLLTNNMPAWVNGSAGTVERIEEDHVWVRLDRGRELAQVAEHDEVVYDGDMQPLFSVKQFPIVLGWALTVHRAQGATIDRVGVDLEGHFAEGQTYVALSRVRTSDGLFLTGALTELLVNPLARALELAITRAGSYRQHLRDRYDPSLVPCPNAGITSPVPRPGVGVRPAVRGPLRKVKNI